MTGVRKQFSEALTNSTESGLRDALDIAGHMSVLDVAAVLVDDIAPDHPERADAFIEAWLPRLLPGERMDAAVATSSLYVLDLVHLPEATDRGFLHDLCAAADVLAMVAKTISDDGEIGESPDASFDREFAQRYRLLSAGPLAEAEAMLRAGVAELSSSGKPPTSGDGVGAASLGGIGVSR